MNSSFAKRIFDVIGIIAGILIIVYGVKLSDNGYYGTLTSDARFGADFYTEQYAATKHAADNINSVGQLIDKICDSMKSLSVVFGIAVVAYFGDRFCDVDTVVQEKKSSDSEMISEKAE